MLRVSSQLGDISEIFFQFAIFDFDLRRIPSTNLRYTLFVFRICCMVAIYLILQDCRIQKSSQFQETSSKFFQFAIFEFHLRKILLAPTVSEAKEYNNKINYYEFAVDKFDSLHDDQTQSPYTNTDVYRRFIVEVQRILIPML